MLIDPSAPRKEMPHKIAEIAARREQRLGEEPAVQQTLLTNPTSEEPAVQQTPAAQEPVSMPEPVSEPEPDFGSDADALSEIADQLWKRASDGPTQAPSWAVPSEAALAYAWDSVPKRVRRTANRRLQSLYTTDAAVWSVLSGRLVAAVVTQHSSEGLAVRSVGQVHADWGHTPENDHPLIPTVRWWQNKIASEHAEPQAPGTGGMLPGIDRAGLTISPREVGMLARDRAARDAVTLQLPDWDSTATRYRPWVTDLYTAAGSTGNTRGRGAPWDEALCVGALLHLRVDDRTGRPPQIAVKARELESWLFPQGRMPHPGRDWHKLPEALRRVDQMRIYLPAINADVRVVAIDSIPRDREDYVSFRLVIPADAARGPRINWQTLVRYRSRSRPAYRAYLASQVILDRTARNGRPVTRLIPARVPGPDGKPVWYQDSSGSKPRRSWKAGTEPHPFSHSVPSYTARDLADIIAIKNPHRAVEAFRQLHKDGIIDLVEERHGRSHQAVFRIYGPADT